MLDTELRQSASHLGQAQTVELAASFGAAEIITAAISVEAKLKAVCTKDFAPSLQA